MFVTTYLKYRVNNNTEAPSSCISDTLQMLLYKNAVFLILSLILEWKRRSILNRLVTLIWKHRVRNKWRDLYSLSFTCLNTANISSDVIPSWISKPWLCKAVQPDSTGARGTVQTQTGEVIVPLESHQNLHGACSASISASVSVDMFVGCIGSFLSMQGGRTLETTLKLLI